MTDKDNNPSFPEWIDPIPTKDRKTETRTEN